MDDQKLWELLGKAGRPSAPPFFAAKVMRHIGEAAEPRRSWVAPVLRWLAPAAVAALFCLAVLPQGAPTTPADSGGELTTLDLVEILSPGDYETLTAAGWPYDNGFLSASL